MTTPSAHSASDGDQQRPVDMVVETAFEHVVLGSTFSSSRRFVRFRSASLTWRLGASWRTDLSASRDAKSAGRPVAKAGRPSSRRTCRECDARPSLRFSTPCNAMFKEHDACNERVVAGCEKHEPAVVVQVAGKSVLPDRQGAALVRNHLRRAGLARQRRKWADRPALSAAPRVPQVPRAWLTTIQRPSLMA